MIALNFYGNDIYVLEEHLYQDKIYCKSQEIGHNKGQDQGNWKDQYKKAGHASSQDKITDQLETRMQGKMDIKSKAKSI